MSCRPGRWQWIGVRAMAVMANQRAVAALGQIELAARIAVVDEQRDAALERADHRRHPVRQLRQDLRAVSVRERLHRDNARRGAPPRRPACRQDDPRARTAPSREPSTHSSYTSPPLQRETRRRQRIEHFVREDDAGHAVLGRTVDPFDARGDHRAAAQFRRATRWRSRRSALGSSMQIAARQRVVRGELAQRGDREATAAAAELERNRPLAAARATPARACRRSQRAKRSPSSGAVTKSPAAPNFVLPAL